jgi:chloramphenicol O-acetyltransferase type B
MNPFENYRFSHVIKDHLKCRHIVAGDYSYYSGYYHGTPFEDCVMYLDEGDNTREGSSTDRLIIGKFCSIASGVKFMMGGNQGHNYEWIASYPLDCFDEDFDGYTHNQPRAHKLKGDTLIGNDVWIGAEAMIMPGIHIGDGAVIAARAVVTKNVDPYEVWGGCPAKKIKFRFNGEEVTKLLKIRWWDWQEAVLKKNLDLLRSRNVDVLWEKHLRGDLG